MSRFVLALAAATAVYLLALASLDPLDALLGAAAAAALLLALRGFLFRGRPQPLARLGSRLAALPGFVFAVLSDITVGTWRVALVVLHVRPLGRPGIVVVPLGDRTETGATVSSLVATLSPGEFLVDFDRERGAMLVHVLDASDPAAVRARFDHFYRRHQQTLVP
jgi:multisubunit Na+/H+ antiporter MnhE subunit